MRLQNLVKKGTTDDVIEKKKSYVWMRFMGNDNY